MLNENEELPIDGNQGSIKVDPNLSTKTAATALDTEKTTGVEVKPASNYKPTQELDNELAPTSVATRSVANEGAAQASLIKPNADSLNRIEKYVNNTSLELQIGNKRDQIKDLVYKMTDLRNKGLDLTNDEKFLLDNHQVDLEDLNQQRSDLKLNWFESAVTGDLVSVFRDIGKASVDSPLNAIVAGSGLLGFAAGPGLGLRTTRVSTAVASAKYNWERTYATSYLDVDERTDANGNPLPHDVKNAIAQTSAYLQSGLEFGADMLLLKTSKLLKIDLINEKLVKYVSENPTFGGKLLDFVKRAGTQGFAESITEVLQDNIGDYAKALGQTWDKLEGLQSGEALKQYAKDFDLSKNLETAARSLIVGGAVVGAGDSTRAGYDKAKDIYKKYTGKNINLGVDETIVESENEGPTSFNGKETQKTDAKIKFNLPVTQTETAVSTDVNPDNAKSDTTTPTEPKGFTVVDGVPVYLNLNDAVILGEIIPNINNISKYNIAESDISKEQLQTELMKRNRVNQVFIDKEKLEAWANTEARKNKVADLFLGDKGVYLDAQKVPITPEEYAALQSMGDVEALTDSTAITSDGATIGDLKEKMKEMGTKKIPNANAIPASKEMNTNPDMDAGQGAETQVNSKKKSGTPNVDEAIKGYEDFGLVTKNVYESMTDTERAAFDKLTAETKAEMKARFREDVLNEYEETVTMQQREADLVAEDEVVNGIMNDDKIITVDTFLADPSLRIDPTTLSENMAQYANDPLLEQRRVFKKGGMHIDEVAAQMGVTPAQLMDALSTTPSSRQAYKTRMKIEEARNRNESVNTTNLNEEAIKATIDNKIKLKKQTLTNIIRKAPRAGLNLIYSVLSVGDKTNVDKVEINAQEITDNTRIGDLSPKSYLNASRRHQNRANKAALNGADMVLAATETEKSIVADELHKAATVTKAAVNRILDQVVRMARNQSVLEKLDSTGHREAFEALTAMLGSRKLKEKDMNTIKNLLITWQENGLDTDSNLPITLESPVIIAQQEGKAINVNDLSLAQIETVKSYIDAVVADSQNTIKNRARENQLFGAIVGDKLEAELQANENYNGNKSATYAKGGTSWYKNWTDKFLGLVRGIEDLGEMLDSFKIPRESVLGLLVSQLQGVGAFANGMGTKYKIEETNRIKNFLNDRMGKETIKRLNGYAGQSVKVPEWANSVGKGTLVASDGSVRLTDMLGMLLIYGSETGRNRLSKFGIDVKSIPDVLQKYLNKDDIKIAQAVWEAHDLLKEGIVVVEKTIKGNNNVQFVEGLGFDWNGERVKGGYIHFTYTGEQDIKLAAEREQEALKKALGDKNAVNDNRAAAGFTKEGFKKARAENVDAFIDLDLNRMVDSSLGDIIANNKMLIPIYNSMKILNDPRNSTNVQNVLGKNGFNVFKHNILALGRGTNFENNQTLKAIDDKYVRPLIAIGNNYMISKIVGSFSSIASQSISVGNLFLLNANKPKLLFNTGITYAKMLINPKSVNDMIEVLGEKIPAVRSDRTNYQVKDVRSLKLFEKSESKNPVVRFSVNATNTFADVWLGKFMGGFDELSKTGYAVALINSWLSGDHKRGPNKEQLMKMSEDEKSRKMAEFVNNELKRIFPDKDETSISYFQRHPIAKLFTLFFNDARKALNYIVFNRIEDIVKGFTDFPTNAAKNGTAAAIGKSGKDIITNTLLLQFHLAVIDSMLRSFRGEDEEADKSTNKLWIERFLKIFKKDILDPYMIAKGTADMIPIASSAKFFMDTDGRAGEITTAFLAWTKSALITMNNLKNTGFNDEEFDDKARREAFNTLSGLVPLPTSVINNYVYGDSTAFQTGLKTVVMGPAAVAIAIKKLLIADTEKAISWNTANAAERSVLDSTISGEMATLMATGEGRATLKNAIYNNEFAVTTDEQLYDIVFAESGGDPTADNPRSSAKGLGQFLTSTWNEQIEGLVGFDKAYGSPDEIPEGQIDGRTDPIQSMQVLREFHKDIATYYIDRGIMPTQENIYMGHHFGKAAAAAILQADDDTLAKTAYIDVVSTKGWNNVTRANPWVESNMTVAEFKEGIRNLLDVGTEKRFKWEERKGVEFDPAAL